MFRFFQPKADPPQAENFRSAILFSIFLVACFLSLVTSSAHAAAYTQLKYDPAGGFATQTLTKDKNPYIINDPCGGSLLKVGRTITIKEGVVVKFAVPNGCGNMPMQLVVNGVLDVQGTAAEPVIFTSVKDDSVAGDTNGDGASSAPAKGDWGRIQLGGSATASATIRNAVIRYGGNSPYGMLQVWSPVASMLFSEIEIASSSSYGLSTFVPLTIHQSSFHDNGTAAIYSVGAGGGASPTVNATDNWWGDNSGPTVASNPGGDGDSIFGNVLYDPWIGKNFDPVIIIPGILGSAEKNGVWLIDPIFHTYDDLIDTLAANGYTHGVDLFTFPYNWRQSNVLTAFQLHQKIDEVKAICGCSKVDLVGHSMGGLVARQYVQSNYYAHDVDQLIFLGTPHLGAPKAYLSWEGGSTGPDREDQLLGFLLSREGKKLGYNSLFDYVRNNPIASVQELLPIYDYLRDKDTGILRNYSNNYPQNIFLENLNNTSSTLFSSGVKITNIVGDAGASSTITALQVTPSSNLPVWENGEPLILEYGAGDVTVPKNSAENINVDINKILSSHRTIPDTGEALIYKKLTNKDATTLINKFYFPDIKILIIKLLSPVDMIVVAPDGKRIGKDFATNQEINEIDGAFYSGFIGDDEYITIPNPLDGEYKVETIGTDNGGEYTVATGLITDQGSSEHDFMATTLPGMFTSLNVEINNSSSTIEVAPEDTEAPIITIYSPEARDYLRSEALIINTTSTDVATGVLSHEVGFDGKILDTQSMINLKLGIHVVSVTSTDFVGNTATSSTNFRLIATASSTISDVDMAFNLGWITKKQVRDDLKRDLGRIVKIEKRIDILEEKLPGKSRVIKQIERLEKTIDKILAKELLRELDRYQIRGWINIMAHKLLTEDINWLLNN